MNWSNPWDLSGSSDPTGWERVRDWLVYITEDCPGHWCRQGDEVKVLGTPVPERPLCGGTTRPLSGTGGPPQGWDTVPCSDWKKAKCPSQGNQRLTRDGPSPGVEYTFLCTFCLHASCALGVCRGFYPDHYFSPSSVTNPLERKDRMLLKGVISGVCTFLLWFTSNPGANYSTLQPVFLPVKWNKESICFPELARGLSEVIDLKCWEQRTHLVFVVIII